MASTIFIDGTVIPSAWANDVNTMTYKSFQNAKTYGAIGDGVADDTAALQLWLNAGGGILPYGTYKISATLNCSVANTQVLGLGLSSAITTTHATADVFNITAQGVIISDIQIVTSVARTAGWYINLATVASNNNCKVLNCSLFNFKNGINISGSLSSTITISGCNLTTNVAAGVGIQYATAANWVDCILENTLISGPLANMAVGLSITNIGDITVRRVQFIQAGIGISITPGNGQIVQYATFSDCLIDSCTSYGILLAPTGTGKIAYFGTVKFVNCWSATNAFGAALSPTNVGLIQRTEFIGCTFANNTNHGLYVGGSTVTDTLVSGGSYTGNTTTGIYVVNGTDGLVIEGARIGTGSGMAGNTNGINLVAGVSNNITIVGNDVRGNITNNILDGSTGSGITIADNQGYGYSSAVYDPPSLADGVGVTTTVTVTGAVVGDMVDVSFSNALQGIILTGWVSAANTVSARFQNESGGVLDLASGALRAAIRRRT